MRIRGIDVSQKATSPELVVVLAAQFFKALGASAMWSG